jgi:CBS domain containing-hemolysin-like protein
MTWVIIALLILINALYVAAEFSAVSVRRGRVRQAAEDGNRFARMLLPVVDDGARLDRYVAVCQIGITISSLVLGAYGQARLAPQLVPVFAGVGGMQEVAAQSTAAIVILFGLTVAQMVLGELVPKSLALQYPTPLALYTVLPMKWSLRAMSWFIFVLNGSGTLILRALGMRQTGHRHLHSPEEIEYLIAESKEGGLFEADEHERLRRALHLGVHAVEDIMIPRVRITAVEVSTPFSEVLDLVAHTPYSRIPVYRRSIDRMLGFVHVQDVVRHSLDGQDITLETLIRPLLVVPEGMKADRVLHRLREGRQHIAIVVDEFGGTKGLVTIGDVLDEIFGGIAEEFPPEMYPEPEVLPDGRIRMTGFTRLDEATLLLGVRFQGESYTLGGLVSEALGRIPSAGDQVRISGVELEVESVEAHVVRSVLARPADDVGATKS